MFSPSKKPILVIDVERGLIMPLDIMIQFGLMINEMFTNTIKYAINEKGIIVTISLVQKGNDYIFTYKDNGKKELNVLGRSCYKKFKNKLFQLYSYFIFL